MNTTGREKIGACPQELLFASSKYPVSMAHVTVASGQGKLSRGTALALNDNGKCVILGTEAATAAYILAADVEATKDVVAEVYRTGHFVKNALIVKDGYKITDDDVEAFRKDGIILDNAMI